MILVTGGHIEGGATAGLQYCGAAAVLLLSGGVVELLVGRDDGD